MREQRAPVREIYGRAPVVLGFPFVYYIYFVFFFSFFFYCSYRPPPRNRHAAAATASCERAARFAKSRESPPSPESLVSFVIGVHRPRVAFVPFLFYYYLSKVKKNSIFSTLNPIIYIHIHLQLTLIKKNN